MNSCQDTRNLLMGALDAGKSNPSEPAREHLIACAPCRAWWEQVHEVERVFRESAGAVPSTPVSLHRRIQAALEEERTPSRSRRVFWRSSGLAVAATLVLAAGVFALLVASRSGQPGHLTPVATRSGQTAAMPSLSALPSLGDLISVPPPVEEARSEFTWLTQAVVSNTQSAARAFTPTTGTPPTPHPTRTPIGREES